MTTDTVEKPKPTDYEQYKLNTGEAGRLLSVSERSILRYIARGWLSAITSVNERGLKQHLLNKQQVLAFKDNADRGVRTLSDNQTAQATGMGDSQPDRQLSDMPIVNILMKAHEREIGRLEETIKTKDDRISQQEEEIKRAIWQMAELTSEVKQLKGSQPDIADSQSDNRQDDGIETSDPVTDSIPSDTTQSDILDSQTDRKNAPQRNAGLAVAVVAALIVGFLALLATGVIK